MRPLSAAAVGVAALLVFPVLARAQSASGERIRIGLSFGTQPASTSFDGTNERTTHLETETITTSYDVAAGSLVDGGAAVLLTGGFGVGVHVSSSSQSRDASLGGRIPHPFFYDTPRAIEGTVPGVSHKELVTHVQAVYVVPAAGRVEVAISGGPSFFSVRQGLVSGVSYADVYPYDSVTFTSATTDVAKENAVGFNAGGDVSVRVATHVGVGVLFRYSRATVDLPLPTGGSVSLDVGGPQVAAGVRLAF